MFKYIAIIYAVIACTMGKPSGLIAPVALSAAPLAYAPAPAIVTATSSQYQVRNHNAFAAPFVASAPLVAAPASYAVAAPLASSAYTYSNSWNLPYAAASYVI